MTYKKLQQRTQKHLLQAIQHAAHYLEARSELSMGQCHVFINHVLLGAACSSFAGLCGRKAEDAQALYERVARVLVEWQEGE